MRGNIPRPDADPSSATTACVFVIYPEGHPLNVDFSEGQTVQDLVVAEQKLHRIADAGMSSFLGTSISMDLPLQDGQAFCLDAQPASNHTALEPPILRNATPAELLWKQQGWTATDEMDFYMYMVEESHPSIHFCR